MWAQFLCPETYQDRNSMSNEKLDSVSIVVIERELAQSLDNDK